MAVKNEKGNTYGRLLVLERVENNKRGDAQWKCKCECGTELVVTGVALRSGHTKSCGCLQRDKVQQIGYNNTADLLNKRFGRLLVKERIPGRKNEIGKWICECECGGITITTSDKLLSGHTMSCGCLQSQGEYKIANFLTEKGISFQKEFSFSDLKRKYVLRFDFAIFKDEQLLCLIEFDGNQHYNPNNYFYNPEIIENDQKKTEYCLLNGIKLYRILYNENIINRMNDIIQEIKAVE